MVSPDVPNANVFNVLGVYDAYDRVIGSDRNCHFTNVFFFFISISVKVYEIDLISPYATLNTTKVASAASTETAPLTDQQNAVKQGIPTGRWTKNCTDL